MTETQTLEDGTEVINETPVATTALEAMTKGEVDKQISTAKRYPRSVSRSVQTATSLATIDEDTAVSCFYALRRQGKLIEGPTVRLAEIMATSWGNLRVQARVTGESDGFLTAEGVAWDLESNVAISVEVRRRITTKQGKRYSDDMITVTANAATAFAVRNAIFKVIPRSITDSVFQRVKKAAVGDVETLSSKRQAAVEYVGRFGISHEQVFAYLGVEGLDDITLKHLELLRGTITAIKGGDITPEEAFLGGKPKPTSGGAGVDEKLNDLDAKSKGAGGGDEGNEEKPENDSVESVLNRILRIAMRSTRSRDKALAAVRLFVSDQDLDMDELGAEEATDDHPAIVAASDAEWKKYIESARDSS